MMKFISWALGVLLFIICLIFFIGKQQITHYLHTSILSEQPTLFTIKKGMSKTELEQHLLQQKIVPNSLLFSIVLKCYPQMGHFKAGTYQLMPNMTIEQLLLLFNSGKEAQFPIQFIEGTTFKEWLVQLSQAPYLKHSLTEMSDEQIMQALGIKEGNAVEGWLFPDTYYYTANTSDLAILTRAHTRMVKALTQSWQGRAPNLPYRNAYEMLIMASIIEKETGIHGERNKVASVFVNRLIKGMKLQTDPTVIYGMGNDYHGTITKKALATETPYNTYLIQGLPPTPIAMPSMASLSAVAHPEKTDYLYFVATGSGGHTFSRNLSDHNKAVMQYRKTLENRKAP